MQEVIGIGHRPHLTAAPAKERLQKLPDLVELLGIGAKQRLPSQSAGILAEHRRIDRRREIQAETLPPECARLDHAPVTHEPLVALALAPFVGRERGRVFPVALERLPEVGIVRPLHLHPPTGLQHRQQRDQVGLECVVMDRIGMFQVGGDNFKPTRDETTAMEAFEDNHVFAKVAVCGFGSHATSSPRSANASSSMSSVTVSCSCNRS